MANKPFAIQGADLTLGGVNLSAGTTGVVIPGVTQAVNFRVKEVDEMPNIGGQDLGSDETAVTVIDNSRYLQLTGTAPSADYVAATYSVDELDELGNIKEIDVETEGVFLTADKNRAEASNMWATLDATPFTSFTAGNWQQIPYRPKMRAGEVENVGGGGGGNTLVNGAQEFTLNADGSVTFPDGSIQTTAYTGSGAVGTFFVVANDDGTVSKSTDGVTWTTGADQGASINRVATNGVTVAMIQSDQLSWTTFAGLEASTYVSGSSAIDDSIGEATIDWNQIDYAGGYFVAVGYITPVGASFSQGVYGYSTDGRSWTLETVDQTVVEFFGNDPVDSDWGFSDIDYNGVGWMFSVDEGVDDNGPPNGGGVYITDLTATITSARCFSMNITYNAAWNGSAWYMEGDNSIAGVNTNLDPRNGTFAGPIDPWATGLQDLGLGNAGGTVETAGGNGYIAASDSDGHVAWSDDNGQTWQIVTPIPYTRTISAITQASPAVVTSSGTGDGNSGEKVVISGSSVSGYNGTFYWNDANNSLYTNQALTTEFDTSGLAPFTGTATLTWSNGEYIDAMDFINGYFYIGNDDEQIARSTNLISWTIVDNQTSSNFEYWNDIAGFVSTGGTGNTLVNGAQEFTLNADGSVTFPDGSIQTTAYTGSDANVWVQTFVSETGSPTDIVAMAVSVEYDSAGNVIALFSHYNSNDSSYYYSVGKYTTTGTKIWTARFADGFTTDGWGLAVAGNNYIYVAGQTLSSDESGYSVSTLTKLNSSDGSIVWSKVYDFGYASTSNVVDVASDGNPVMVGYVTEGDSYVSTVKVDAADGSIVWARLLDGQGNEEAYGMAVGPTGEVVAIGYMSQLGQMGDTDDHMLVVKYASDGTIAWQKAILFDAGYDCRGADADIDSDGNIYVTGSYQYDSEFTGTTSALSILKLDSGGVKQWSRRVEGTCETFGVSVVVGADDKLYLSGVTGFAGYTGVGEPDLNNGFTWVAAKYGFDGTVEWQRLIDHTDSWSFAGDIWFGGDTGGGSNLAVKDGYVVFGGGFGNQADSEDPRATVAQVSATGDTFSTGPWAFTAASFSGLLNSSASDITVVDAEKTDSGIEISVVTATPSVDISNFLIGTLYTAPGGNNSLVNGSNQLVLETTGAVTLPQGGTITEGYVTSNPTIQLTPASPSVASQKLVIKGGGSYSNTENGISLTTYNITWAVSTTVEFNVYDLTRANETLYWWIVPEGSGISTTMSGTVALDGNGDGNFTFTLDSDAYEFRVRVSPEDNNYDPDNTGVESVLLNSDEDTYPYHHLHLTTGNLEVTSIFLGTDDQNVRTAVNGSIQITTSDTMNNVWEFDTDGATTFPTLTVPISDNATPSGTGQTIKFGDSSQQAIIFGPEALSPGSPSAQRVIIQGAPGYTGTAGEGGDVYVWAGPGGSTDGNGGDIKVRAGQGDGSGSGGYLNFQAGDSGTGNGGWINIESGQSNTYGNGGEITVQAHDGGEIFLRTHNSITTQTWTFAADGALTLAKDIIVGNNGGHIYQDAGQAGNPSSIKWVNMTGANNMLRVFADDRTTMADERLNVAWDDGNGFTITTYSTTDSTWTFGIDGSTTLPGAVINSTVAKTGIAYNTGTATALEDSTYIGAIVDGNYGPFTRGLVTFTVVVTSGVAAYTVTATTGNTAVGAVIGTLDTGDLGGTSGSTSNISVADVVQAATAIDLTKSVNKLTDGGYTLANGVEGQIMYLVAQNGVVPADVSVLVANSRNIGEATLFPFRVYDYSDDSYYDTVGGFCTLIFTDGAWQQTGGAWEIIT